MPRPLSVGNDLLVTLELVDPSEAFLILTTRDIALIELLVLLQMSSVCLNDQNSRTIVAGDECSTVLT